MYDLRQRVEQTSSSLLVPGMVYIEHFIADDEEKALLDFIDSQPWPTTIGQRRVQQYGARYVYSSRTLSADAPPIPKEIQVFIARLKHLDLVSTEPDQVIVNEYTHNQGIAVHTDHQKLFGPEIVSVSLGCNDTMDFKKGDKMASVMLHRRSAIVLKGEARHEWTHGIRPKSRRTRRVSITLRTINK